MIKDSSIEARHQAPSTSTLHFREDHMQINIRLSHFFGASLGYDEDQHLMAVRGLLHLYKVKSANREKIDKIRLVIADIDAILRDDYQYSEDQFEGRSPKDLFEHYLHYVSRDWKLLAELRPN